MWTDEVGASSSFQSRHWIVFEYGGSSVWVSILGDDMYMFFILNGSWCWFIIVLENDLSFSSLAGRKNLRGLCFARTWICLGVWRLSSWWRWARWYSWSWLWSTFHMFLGNLSALKFYLGWWGSCWVLVSLAIMDIEFSIRTCVAVLNQFMSVNRSWEHCP